MQRLGLLDEHGNLTERGHKWRGDDTYAEACQEILDDIYPADLSGFTTANGSPDKAMVKKWFQQQKFGESNARQMAVTYVMIAEKKLPEPTSDKQAKPKAKVQGTSTTAKASSASRKPVIPTVAEDTAMTSAPPSGATPTPARPDIHLDFQIHIAADTKAETIDQIFASMAKHLYPTA